MWHRIQFEIAADEVGIGDEPEEIGAVTLSGFGLPTPDRLVGIALRYQIAQKLHAVTDPHDPPTAINDRAPDVVDLVLLEDLVAMVGSPRDAEIAAAAQAAFAGRADEAAQLGGKSRNWPTLLTAYPHWAKDYQHAAASANLDLPFQEAVARVNGWIEGLVAVSGSDAEENQISPTRR